LFDIEQEMYRIQWLMNAEKFDLQENNEGE
jgi:hypothetical protein